MPRLLMVLCTLLLLTVAFWVLSLWWLVHFTPCTRFRLSLDRGALTAIAATPLGEMHDQTLLFVPNRWGMQWSFRSHQIGRWHYGGPFDIHGYEVSIPLWAPAPVVAIAAATIFLRSKPFLARPRHCSTCRYDLTGLAAQCTCPECGCRQPA